ncbi:MAG: hypothetical protein WBQ60_12300 [Asticcacaulis sp.]
MKNATKTLIAIIAMTASLSAASLSANAAPMGHNDHPAMQRMDMRATTDFRDRLNSLRNQIMQGQRSHRLSPVEAQRLTKKINDLAVLQRSYERSGNGLNRTEIARLDVKANTLSNQIQTQMRDHNRR